ncbi:hypothetical protein ABZ725_14105 [Streptomyces sp. NPDC006872]|uniref:hypothetical protein n=1 Tax=Streptomyces sp. NPDC006872 TaxID=3155720 RepID=UPI0033C6589A
MTTKTMHQNEGRLRAVLATLAERWEQLAGPKPDPDEGLFVDQPGPDEYARVERAHAYRTAASDLRDVLRTGQIPHPIMTDAELERHGTVALDNLARQETAS